MIKAIPQVRQGCKVLGALYNDRDKSSLGEDMVEIVLPNGVLVSTGWYPEGDPNGSYRVVATSGFDYLAKVTTKQFSEAFALTEDFARRFGDISLFTSDTSESDLLACA